MRIVPSSVLGLALVCLLGSAPAPLMAADWPMSGFDSQRSGASPDDLPAKLALHWVRELPPLKPAWPDQPKLQFDANYEPIVAGGRVFVGSSRDDSVTAYDAATGQESWKFFANGPIRFAPVAWNGKLYVVADDGYLYCLQASDGKLAWKFRGGPSDRKLLGNERLISAWPARGAPVIEDGKLYFSAGIWPFMGIFLHALDAETGDVLWTNSGDGSIYIKQPHNTDSFAGVAPQGALVVTGKNLLIPGGRSVPACYDRATGRLVHYQLGENGKRGGGSTVSAANGLYFNGGGAFSLASGSQMGSVGDLVVVSGDKLFSYRDGSITVFDVSAAAVKTKKKTDRKGEKTTTVEWEPGESAKVKTPKKLTALIRAGSRLYGGTEKGVVAIELPLPKKGDAKVDAELAVDGTVAQLAAAGDKLFVTTTEGRIYCFGAAAAAPKTPQVYKSPAAPAADDAWQDKVAKLLETAKTRDGYCLAWGVGSGGLVKELARQSELRIVVIEPDAGKANDFRRALCSLGLETERVAVLVADPLAVRLPPYLASVMVAEELPAEAKEDPERFLSIAFESLRPYGGSVFLPLAADNFAEFQKATNASNFAGAQWRKADPWGILSRVGALPGSANWTHEHADASNTRVSKDSRVKAPLGLLWFGGVAHDGVLPRHGHGPQPQVIDGRLFIEGVDFMRATDIYTGRLLWQTDLPGVGDFYNNTSHQPGANASGANYVSTFDGIYIAYGKRCVVLDPPTGLQQREFALPVEKGADEPPEWGYINVAGNYLIGGAEPLFDPASAKSRSENDNHSSSGRLVVMDRHSGKVLWSKEARSGFRHNAICVGDGRLYCIDRLSGPQLSKLKRRGEKPKHPPTLTAFDLATGKELWSIDHDVFGTWLSYSAERDILVEAGRQARDTIEDEPPGMRTYRGASGEVLWTNESYRGPAMIHHDTILMAGSACDLLTGEKRMREHPLSGEPVEWSWSRNYGCNTPAASEHLLTFRSGAAGYFDMCNDGGTGNFGGFKSSCTNNLIVAGGLLNAPDYTRTCTCNYQNQTSVALIHMPEVETWTSFGRQTPKQRLTDLGINLGAPGDRKGDDGTLWLEYPSVGGASPEVEIDVEPKQVEWFRRHSSQVQGEGLAWVAASGAKGLTALRIQVGEKAEGTKRYTVRLHFLEPDDVQPGQRVFRVALQGDTAIARLDVAGEAGGSNVPLVKEFKGVAIEEELRVDLAPLPTSKEPAAVLSGVELHIEGE